jgi:hypothetical protein
MTITGDSNPNWKGGISKDKKAYQKKWFQENKERNRKKSREWYQKNQERGKEINQKSNKKIKLMVLQYYGGELPQCSCCKEKEQGFLTIDHINNDGAEHRRKIQRGGGVGFYYWLKTNNFPDGFQVLCFNCNISKSLYGRCPHKNI